MTTLNDSPARWCIVCGKLLQNKQRYFCSRKCQTVAVKRKTPRTQQFTKPHTIAQPKLSLAETTKLAKQHLCTYGQLMYKLYRGEIKTEENKK